MMSKQRTSSGVLSGNQVMLQRQAPLQQQSGQKYHDSIQRDEQKSQGGVISMKEGKKRSHNQNLTPWKSYTVDDFSHLVQFSLILLVIVHIDSPCRLKGPPTATA